MASCGHERTSRAAQEELRPLLARGRLSGVRQWLPQELLENGGTTAIKAASSENTVKVKAAVRSGSESTGAMDDGFVKTKLKRGPARKGVAAASEMQEIGAEAVIGGSKLKKIKRTKINGSRTGSG